MAPIWLVRFNEILVWLNPALCIVAALLAAVVFALAAERPSSVTPGTMVQAVAESVAAPASAAHQRLKVPPEWRDMLLHD